MNNRAYGAIGEDAAVAYLNKHGYKVLCRNFRVGKMGELDIIGMENGTLCFIEVKTRSNEMFGTPAQAVSVKKQATIVKLAQIYMQNHRYNDIPVRFDVMELMMDRTGGIKDIQHIQNAF